MLAVSGNYWLFVFLVFLVCVGEAVKECDATNNEQAWEFACNGS